MRCLGKSLVQGHHSVRLNLGQNTLFSIILPFLTEQPDYSTPLFAD
jgi:hypothetical protein